MCPGEDSKFFYFPCITNSFLLTQLFLPFPSSCSSKYFTPSTLLLLSVSSSSRTPYELSTFFLKVIQVHSPLVQVLCFKLHGNSRTILTRWIMDSIRLLYLTSLKVLFLKQSNIKQIFCCFLFEAVMSNIQDKACKTDTGLGFCGWKATYNFTLFYTCCTLWAFSPFNNPILYNFSSTFTIFLSVYI